jgi:hypothetical protein
MTVFFWRNKQEVPLMRKKNIQQAKTSLHVGEPNPRQLLNPKSGKKNTFVFHILENILVGENFWLVAI